MTPWSGSPRAGWPNAAARAASPSILQAPSSNEYSLWTWRCTAGAKALPSMGSRADGPGRLGGLSPHLPGFGSEPHENEAAARLGDRLAGRQRRPELKAGAPSPPEALRQAVLHAAPEVVGSRLRDIQQTRTELHGPYPDGLRRARLEEQGQLQGHRAVRVEPHCEALLQNGPELLVAWPRYRRHDRNAGRLYERCRIRARGCRLTIHTSPDRDRVEVVAAAALTGRVRERRRGGRCIRIGAHVVGVCWSLDPELYRGDAAGRRIGDRDRPCVRAGRRARSRARVVSARRTCQRQLYPYQGSDNNPGPPHSPDTFPRNRQSEPHLRHTT